MSAFKTISVVRNKQRKEKVFKRRFRPKINHKTSKKILSVGKAAL